MGLLSALRRPQRDSPLRDGAEKLKSRIPGIDTWTPTELRLFGRLSSPIEIQRYLNRMAYDPDYGARSPRWIIKERKAHCFEGAIFAAAALRQLRQRPRRVDIRACDE